MAEPDHSRRVAVTGPTGTIGRAVVAALRERGDDVLELSRSGGWDPASEPAPLAGAGAVIHLAGEPIAQRWSEAAKREIRDSRVLGTRSVVEGMRAAGTEVLISQSGVGYYGPHGPEELAEDAAAGDDFLARVCVEWEAEAKAAEALGARVVLARTGVVISPSGGALEKMLPPFKAGVGGPVAGGGQYVPWIDLEDEVHALLFCLDHAEVSGPVNLTAPTPVTNKELSKALGKVLGRPALFPVPGLALKALYGEMSEIVTTGQNVAPSELKRHGYEFRRPVLEDSLRTAVA